MYSECLKCEKLGVTCNGPTYMDMPANHLLNWCRDRKNALRWSNQKLAEMSGIAKGTIDRLFSGENLDFKYETIRPIIKALVGGKFQGNPCSDPSGLESGNLKERIRQLEADVLWRDDKIAHIMSENKTVHAENSQLKANLDAMRKEYKLDLSIMADKEAGRTEDLRRRVAFQEEQLKVKDAIIMNLLSKKE